MKYLNFILTGIASLALMGCALGPHMRMDASSDNFDYNGVKVFVHELSEGDFGQDVPAKGIENAEIGDVSELYVDSKPNLEYRIGPMDMVHSSRPSRARSAKTRSRPLRRQTRRRFRWARAWPS